MRTRSRTIPSPVTTPEGRSSSRRSPRSSRRTTPPKASSRLSNWFSASARMETSNRWSPRVEIGAHLRLAPAQVAGDGALALGRAGEADGPLHGHLLGPR